MVGRGGAEETRVSRGAGDGRGSVVLPGSDPVAPHRPPWVLYVDLDAFYVACELRDRPDLKGRPVIVGPPPAERPTRGVVLSASYEARAFGVRSAQPIRRAAELCPDAVWIPPDFAKYGAMAGRVRDLLRRFAPKVVPYSIDEAVLEMAGGGGTEATEVARRLQSTLLSELGLSASVGVATSRVVAKIACEQAKPGGLRVVPPDGVAGFVGPLSVRVVPGVGPKTGAALERIGVRTIGELLGTPQPALVRAVGSFARELTELARGRPREPPLVEDRVPRSRSTDRTFDEDITAWDRLESAVRELARDLGRAVQEEGWRFGAVGAAFRWSDFTRTLRVRTLPAASSSPATLEEEAVREARSVWSSRPPDKRGGVRTVSVRVERLTVGTGRQASIDEVSGSGPGSSAVPGP